MAALAGSALVWWLVRRKREGKPALIDPVLFESSYFRLGISQQMLQQIALGGMMTLAFGIIWLVTMMVQVTQHGLIAAPNNVRARSQQAAAGKAGELVRLARRIPGLPSPTLQPWNSAPERAGFSRFAGKPLAANPPSS